SHAAAATALLPRTRPAGRGYLARAACAALARRRVQDGATGARRTRQHQIRRAKPRSGGLLDSGLRKGLIMISDYVAALVGPRAVNLIGCLFVAVDLEWKPWQHGAVEGPSGAHRCDSEVAPIGFDGQL
ncbi:unnamed protein product, partial [Urochloa humidicola]